jgi:hypothetical protein
MMKIKIFMLQKLSSRKWKDYLQNGGKIVIHISDKELYLAYLKNSYNLSIKKAKSPSKE